MSLFKALPSIGIGGCTCLYIPSVAAHNFFNRLPFHLLPKTLPLPLLSLAFHPIDCDGETRL
ncbi:MAG: hypothetical protein AAGE59_12670 [Cyanobacteria bacterium P01_F01_bin.86]